MGNIGDILTVFFISLVFGTITGFMMKSRKVTRKDFKREDYNRSKGTDITLDL